eukprot:m.40892 g.40892  ORF g.40892 m.40892 type:complete len:612 (+) comp6960_c0_seq1:37-1872(+)
MLRWKKSCCCCWKQLRLSSTSSLTSSSTSLPSLLGSRVSFVSTLRSSSFSSSSSTLPSSSSLLVGLPVFAIRYCSTLFCGGKSGAACRALSTTVFPSAHAEDRHSSLRTYEESGKSLYPVINKGVTQLSQFRQTYKLKDGERLTNIRCTIAGRITSKRQSGKKLCFYHIDDGTEKIQVIAFAKDAIDNYDFGIAHNALKRGDIAEIEGYPGMSKSNELSLIATNVRMLAPCLHDIPSVLLDVNAQLVDRPLHMLVNDYAINAVKLRAKLLATLRDMLNRKGFVEVETPILSNLATGALARPFTTTSHSLNKDLSLRIAPELYLKRLVIGGLPRVYEIGKVFRNEGIDSTHNPEFTSCELYLAYEPFETLFTLTEEILFEIVTSAKNSGVVSSDHPGAIVEFDRQLIDFTPPLNRIHFVDTIEKETGIRVVDNETGECLETKDLLNLCEKLGLDLHKQSPCDDASDGEGNGIVGHCQASLLDLLAEKYVEPKCVQPTFVFGVPSIMSPLAKDSETELGISQRFEMFVAGKELVNAYNELNIPEVQRNRFIEQQAHRLEGDAEAHVPDENFCRALEFGLPPTVGWGLGIDRLIMFLSNRKHIRDILAFPMKGN